MRYVYLTAPGGRYGPEVLEPAAQPKRRESESEEVRWTAATPPSTMHAATAVQNRAKPFAAPGHTTVEVTYECGGRQYCAEVRFLGAAEAADAEVKAAIRKVIPSVVQIRGTMGNRSKMGSGVIIDPTVVVGNRPLPPRTYAVLTNHHVAKETELLVVTLPNGEEVVAQPLKSLVGDQPVMDALVDQAILLIQSPVDLPVARLGDAAALEAGDTVLTAGFPLGMPQVTVTKGIVSQPAQATTEPVHAIQADAAINPGNSGGPLFNLRGEIVGLNTFTYAEAENLSFAPAIVNGRLTVLQTLYATGRYPRGDLRITLEEFPYHERVKNGFPLVDDAGHPIYGALVGAILPSSPAHGVLEPGDVITELIGSDGARMDLRYTNPFHGSRIAAQIHQLPPGSEVLATVYRPHTDGDRRTYAPMQIVLTVGLFGDVVDLARAATHDAIARAA